MIVLLFFLMFTFAMPLQAAPNLSRYTRSHTGGGVTVSAVHATPDYFRATGDTALANRYRAATQIVFLLTFDTHAGDLTTFNVMKNIRLRTSVGREVSPLRWETTGNATHHRAGALIFPSARGGAPVIGPRVGSIALVIRNLVGVPRRTLEWTVPLR